MRALRVFVLRSRARTRDLRREEIGRVRGAADGQRHAWNGAAGGSEDRARGNRVEASRWRFWRRQVFDGLAEPKEMPGPAPDRCNPPMCPFDQHIAGPAAFALVAPIATHPASDVEISNRRKRKLRPFLPDDRLAE